MDTPTYPARAGTLRAMLQRGDFVVAPGVFEMLGAKIADRMNFQALYMTGYGIAGSHLGQPDAGLAGYTDMQQRARTIAHGTSKPLIADADTGFGGLINIRHTVRGYEEAGVQAIQLEDQESPKKCGHTPDRRVVPLEDAVRRIEVAVAARRSDDFLVIARTDARTGLGLDEAIRRALAFAQAGADIVFVESPESEDEFARVGQALAGRGAWLIANMVPTGRSPELSAARLRELGFALAIWPAVLMQSACAAMENALSYLARHGTTAGSPVPSWPMQQLHQLVGFDEVWAFEQRWAR
ncbi:isocitrate lyase/PEP mutase family protein [Ramlibacter sp.]|uniref:isocitrate lyase/PEP mutase family protein n=1 Tax=Ramlibacter sp. TaxID=1917967 RepID=UPI002C470284|nr:isocitrate lyase/PEP mutase family protein [Ramlibacter sp.]HWI82115.1 isocitrate lyase/PEP mutase family protein [Ramlibacter sp.]